MAARDDELDRDQERLDRLKVEIEETRRQAKEHGTLPHEHHKSFIDPDGDGDTDDDPGVIGGL
jgi:hypothetical protein